jgi:hypothetical protein
MHSINFCTSRRAQDLHRVFAASQKERAEGIDEDMEYCVPLLNRRLPVRYQVCDPVFVVSSVTNCTRYQEAYVAEENEGRRAAPE